MLRINKPLSLGCLCHVGHEAVVLPPLCAGEEAAVFVLYRRQRKRMGDGISNSLHQGDRWSSSQRGATGRTKEWSCEYLHKQPCSLAQHLGLLKQTMLIWLLVYTWLDLT